MQFVYIYIVIFFGLFLYDPFAHKTLFWIQFDICRFSHNGIYKSLHPSQVGIYQLFFVFKEVNGFFCYLFFYLDPVMFEFFIQKCLGYVVFYIVCIELQVIEMSEKLIEIFSNYHKWYFSGVKFFTEIVIGVFAAVTVKHSFPLRNRVIAQQDFFPGIEIICFVYYMYNFFYFSHNRISFMNPRYISLH